MDQHVNAHPTAAADPYAHAQAAAHHIRALTGIQQFHRALIMGSGWSEAADLLGDPLAEISYTDLPHFSRPAVPGHSGTLRIIDAARPTLLFLGRTHLYEGHGPDAAVHSTRTAAALGVSTLVLTNGCGSTRPDWAPGTPVLLSDHLNLTGTSPLTGATFIDMGQAYTPRLRQACHAVRPDLAEGVYAQFRGPSYETPAEVRMARTLGADLVGMSTALEAIAARAAGLDVLGISLVTNLAAGVAEHPLDHAEVVAAGKAAAPALGRFLADILTRDDL